MTPLQIDIIKRMREGWLLSGDLLLRSPFGSSEPTTVVHRQTFNGLLRRKLITRNGDSNMYKLTEDGKTGALL